VLFFYPLGTKTTNYFINSFVLKTFNQIFFNTKYYFQAYDYCKHFNYSSNPYTQRNNIFNASYNIDVLQNIILDINNIKKTNNFESVMLFGFSIGGGYIYNIINLLSQIYEPELTAPNDQYNGFNLIDYIITINSKLVYEVPSSSPIFLKKQQSKPIDIVKWTHLYDPESPEKNSISDKSNFNIKKITQLHNQRNIYIRNDTYIHTRWLFDINVYYQIVQTIVNRSKN
jgi:hypothetical protein